MARRPRNAAPRWTVLLRGMRVTRPRGTRRPRGSISRRSQRHGQRWHCQRQGARRGRGAVTLPRVPACARADTKHGGRLVGA